LERVIDSGESPKKIVLEERLSRISGDDQLSKVAEEVISENPQACSDYRAGKKEALNYLMGKVMGKMRGRADAEVVRRLLTDRL
jgi:aspartyl-tRNA(Asn)/glutamyl-tRNA(Gln) amidotransferase subunit B